MQQTIALFVLKSDAGFKIFTWIATLASDFLSQAYTAAVFFFDQETVDKHWFFINVLAAIIFFVAFVQMYVFIDFGPRDARCKCLPSFPGCTTSA